MNDDDDESDESDDDAYHDPTALRDSPSSSSSSTSSHNSRMVTPRMLKRMQIHPDDMIIRTKGTKHPIYINITRLNQLIEEEGGHTERDPFMAYVGRLPTHLFVLGEDMKRAIASSDRILGNQEMTKHVKNVKKTKEIKEIKEIGEESREPNEEKEEKKEKRAKRGLTKGDLMLKAEAEAFIQRGTKSRERTLPTTTTTASTASTTTSTADRQEGGENEENESSTMELRKRTNQEKLSFIIHDDDEEEEEEEEDNEGHNPNPNPNPKPNHENVNSTENGTARAMERATKGVYLYNPPTPSVTVTWVLTPPSSPTATIKTYIGYRRLFRTYTRKPPKIKRTYYKRGRRMTIRDEIFSREVTKFDGLALKRVSAGTVQNPIENMFIRMIQNRM